MSTVGLSCLPDVQVSEILGTWDKGRGLRWVEGRIAGPAGSQREAPEGGQRGPWTSDQSRPWEVIGQEGQLQHFLTSRSHREWEPGMRGGVSGGQRGDSQVLPGVKVRTLRQD